MCGITGVVWNVHDKAVDRNSLDRMTDVLRHRGPDGRGVHYQADGNSGGVGLGHRRLSIIDLASGAQPLANEDETIWITFNGEIYNYQELHAELAAKGHCFRTKSDTETIVHLYEEDGIHCLSRLRGMFALAIWDQRRQRLFLARDRMGQKPLVYHEEPGRLLFASEIKAILQAPGVSRVVDPIALDEYLTYGYVPHPRTMFTGIRKLPPAHYAVYERGHLRVNCYWSSEFSRDSTTDQAQMRESLDHELSEAVRLRLRSDVPLGAFLSGGVDSTIIVGLMQRHLARVNAARGSAKIAAKTYTIGFPVSQYDETEFAQIAADHLHAEHFQQIVQPEAINLLPVLAWHFDEPFGDSSAIPTHQLCKMTREHVTVALTGDGGDELFAGYGRYQTIHRLAAFDRLPGGP